MVNVSLGRFTPGKGRRYQWVYLRTSLDVWEYKKISCAGGILTPDGWAHSLAVVNNWTNIASTTIMATTGVLRMWRNDVMRAVVFIEPLPQTAEEGENVQLKADVWGYRGG